MAPPLDLVQEYLETVTVQVQLSRSSSREGYMAAGSGLTSCEVPKYLNNPIAKGSIFQNKAMGTKGNIYLS